MTRSELDADILRLCTFLVEDLGAPTVKTEVLQMQPVKVHVGITIPEVSPEMIHAALTPAAIRDAIDKAWPPRVGGFMVNVPPKSIGIAADDVHVILDLVLYSVSLESEAHLQPKA